MKNKEKFAKEIIEGACSGSKLALYNGEIRACKSLMCSECEFCSRVVPCDSKRKAWAESEYVEYETDWSKVPVDTPVVIRGAVEDRRYFDKLLANGRLVLFPNGRTSWSTLGTFKKSAYSKSDVVLAREEDKLKYRKQVE